jgi:hypothetical protein
MKIKIILISLLFLLNIPVSLFADDNKINGTCPGEVIEEINGATSDASHIEKGAIGWGGNDRYRMTFRVDGTLTIHAYNRNAKANANYYFYVSRNSCGNDDADWNIVSKEYGTDHQVVVKVHNGDTIYVRLQSIKTEPNKGQQWYALSLDFKSACHGCDCTLDDNRLNSSSPGIPIPGLDGAMTDINRCISGITDQAEGEPDKNDYYYFTVATDGVLKVTTSSPNNHKYHMEIWKNGQTVYGNAYITAESHNVPDINLKSGDKIVVWFKETGDDLDEYQANFDFKATAAPAQGDIIQDLCYEDVEYQNVSCGGGIFGTIFNGTTCTKQSINIKNQYQDSLSDVTIELNLTNVGTVQKDDCGVDSNSGNCQDQTGDIVEYTMPNYAPKDTHSIYLTSDKSSDILSDHLYATYTKNRKIYKYKLKHCHVSYCEKHNLSEGFHVIDPDGGDESNSFEIYCDMTSPYAPRDLIALPIKTANNYNNNFVYDKDRLATVNYYKEAKDHSKSFQAIEIDVGTMEVITRSSEPTDTGTYATLGEYFSNINLIGTPFGIDWNQTEVDHCDATKLRKAYHGQAVKVNLLNYTNARCHIKHMKLKLLDDYKYLTYLGREVLEHSCKEMSENVPANILDSKDIKGHYWIYPRKDSNDTTTTRADAPNDITKANERPIVVYCWYQTDLDWAWTFLLSLDGVVTNSKNDIMAKRDTCSQLGLWFFVPNSKETFNRVRKYLLSQKTGDLGWENYTGTVREKYKTYRNNPAQEYYLKDLGYELIWPYGPLGIYYPCRGHQDATHGCSRRAWYPGRTNVKGWMSGSPMHNIKTLANYADSMGAKGWVSILGEQDLNITNDWWVSDIGAGEEFGPKPPPAHQYSYNPHGTHILTSQNYPYYEPNGNYAKNAWLNFLHDDEGWIYHNDDNNAFYAYYDYMCMSETNYITANRYLLVPGFFNTIERGTRYGNTPPNFADDSLTTQIVNKPINLDLILYKFDINGSQINIDRTQLERDFNKSVGVFLATKTEDKNELKLVKFLGSYKDFDKYNGRIPLKTFTVDRSYRNAFLHYYYCQEEGRDWQDCWDYQENPVTKEITVTHIANTEANASDSYDSFAIRPDHFEIENIPTTPIIAGDEFNLTLKAIDGNTSNPQPVKGYNRPINIDWGAPALGIQKKISCIKGKLELAPNSTANFTDGVANVTLIYSEVGDVNLTLKEYQGSEYAKIDVNDTDFNATIHDNTLGLNPQDIYREINSTQAENLKFTPSHFDINTSLRDFHLATSPNDMNYTYISKDLNMSAVLDFSIIAKNLRDEVTKNYNNECDARDIQTLDLSYLINSAVAKDTSAPSPNPGGLDKILFELKDDKGNYKYPSSSQTLGAKISFTNIPSTVFSTDHNGSAVFELKLNFDRKMNKPVQPFKFTIKELNATDVNGVKTKNLNQKGDGATYLYGRVKSSQKLYDDVTSDSTKTPISIVVYSLPAGTVNLDHALFTPTNEYDWLFNTIHDVAKGDGNVLLSANSNGTVTPTPNFVNGKDDNVIVRATNSKRPLEVDIMLSGTDNWLIYNPDKDAEPIPFYKVRFIDGGGNWTGFGKTGKVVDTNSSKIKTKRLEW